MFRDKRVWMGLILLALVTSGGYAYYTRIYLPSQVAPASTISTAQVSEGDLVISVSGSGTLVPVSEVELGFESESYLAEVLVEVGDRVRAGDLLARLETDELELTVAEADIAARQAQLDLDEVREGATEAELADAEAAFQSAQTALTTAQYTYDSAQNSDLDASVRAYLIHYQWYADRYAEIEQGSAAPDDVEEAWSKRAQAEAELNDVLNEAEMEQLDASNQVAQARNRVYQAQEKLTALESGPTEEDILRAQLRVDQATLALENARTDLVAAELRAPFDGVVVDVMAIPGQHVGTGAIITLVDLEEPVLQFWVEETDLSSVAVGNRVEILFEALPDEVFTGEVTRVDPALVKVASTLAIQAWAKVDTASQSMDLVGGMNAEIEVIAAESRETLLVPMQALRELAEDQYAVFVVQSDGELALRPVDVGLQDFVYAEILSGLQAGEVISVGVEESTEAEGDLEEVPIMGAGGPGTRMLEGGGRPPGGP